jgi:branched-chain amino acid aminotransferase
MTRHTYPYAYFQKKVLPIEEAKISIASNSFQYGTSCFAGIRGYFREGKIRLFRLEDHYQRLMNGVKILDLGFYLPFLEFEQAIKELVSKNQPKEDFYIRPIVFTQEQKIGPKPQGMTYELAIHLVPMGHYFDPNKGMRLMISSWRKFSDTTLPTKAKASGCYVNSFLATGEALRCGYDDALMLDEAGFVVEASVANILLVTRDKLMMPPLGAAQLEGITMRTIVELLAEENRPVTFGPVDRSMIYTCDELMMMGTAAQVTFVDSVDGRRIGSKSKVESPKPESAQPGPICQLLRKKFQAIIDKEHPKATQWILEI